MLMQFYPPQEFTLPFTKKVQVSKDAYSFFFDRTKFTFNFYPGQYIRMTIPHEGKDERGDGRFFSIASSPLLTQELDITTRIVQSSFKKALFNVSPGQEVKFFGPIGRFVFDEEELNPRVFLAGGIGITPFKSIIDYVYQKKITTPITLFASFTTREDFVFYEELQKISQEMPSIKVVFTVTKPELSQATWTGETGRITDLMIKKYVPDLANCITMSCGPGAMLEAMVKLMTDLGVSPQNNRKEVFTGY
jgi:ferredoxin-NADP reductase